MIIQHKQGYASHMGFHLFTVFICLFRSEKF